MSALFVLSFVYLYVCFVQGQSICKTPRGENGQCISIKECPALMDLVANPQRTEQDVVYLRNSHCGFTEQNYPKVCCPLSDEDRRCFTPDEYVGTCVGVKNCPTITNLLTNKFTEENRTFATNSRCEGPDKYSVCCGPIIFDGIRRPIRTCTPTATPRDPRTECCGLDNSSGNRIFGGTGTAVDQYPWLTMIEYRGVRDNKIKLLCGGALISHKYVLTAGHCVAGPVLRIGTPINVRLGEYDTANNGTDCVEVEGGGEDCADPPVIIPIEKVIPHKDYNPDSQLRRHDIGLLRLKDLAPYTDFIRPICLPTKDVTQDASMLNMVVAGWGAVSDKQSFSNVKLQVELPLRSMQECQPSYSIQGRRVQLWKGQLCAGGVAGKDSCKGDSGGPLMTDNGRIYTVDGIVSFGPTPCGMEDVPGVYTKVYEYLPWIRTHMKP